MLAFQVSGNSKQHIDVKVEEDDGTRELVCHGADVHAIDILGQTALIWASISGIRGLAEFLIQNNADVNAKDNENRTALSRALSEGHTDIVQLLKEGGAKEE